MSSSFSSCFLVLAALFTSGCALSAAGEESINEAELSLATANALTANALTANALFPNALSANTLAATALAEEAMTLEARAAIEDPGAAGDLSRKLLKYAVGCAFGSSQSFAFSWTDAQGVHHDEKFPGSLGIAPSWAQGPLDPLGQRMISACLAARTNYYGVTVAISARSATAPLDTLGDDELAAFPNVEGAFWGNVFSPEPFLNACFNTATVANSHQRMRDCAAGHVNGDGTVSSCGMIERLGDCTAVCPKRDGRYYQSCFDGPEAAGAETPYVITIALP